MFTRGRIEEIHLLLASAPEYQPYVTANGGVVILNGPFPVKQAEACAELIKIVPSLIPELLAALEEAQQRAVRWEKAFDNADRNYLKKEKEAADLRRSLDKFQKLASNNHTLAAGFEGDLAEAQQTIARQRESLERIEEELTDDTTERAQRINAIIGAVLGNKEGEKTE